MKTIDITVGTDRGPIPLGMQGESNVRQIRFDCAALTACYGNGTAALSHQRSQDTDPYPAAITQDGSTILWTVSNADTALTPGTSGHGACQLEWYTDSGLARTLVWETEVIRSLSDTLEAPPDAVEPWYRKLLDAVASHTVDEDRLADAVAAYLTAHPVSAVPSGWRFDHRITTEEDADSVTIPMPDGASELMVSGILRAGEGTASTTAFYPTYAAIAVNGVSAKGVFGFYDYYPGTGDVKFNLEMLTDESSRYAQVRVACGAINGNVTKPLVQSVCPWSSCGDIAPSAPDPNFASWHSLQINRSGIAAGSTFDLFVR